MKPKGPNILTANGVMEQVISQNEEERELFVAKMFCKTYSIQNNCNIRVEKKHNPPKPDIMCSLNKNELFLELTELVSGKQLKLDDYNPIIEKYFKDEFNKRFKCPDDLCIEVIFYELKEIPNINKKNGVTVIIKLIEDIGNKLDSCRNLEPGEWKYIVWKKYSPQVNFKITKLPSLFPVPLKSGIKVILAGTNIIDSEVHNSMLTKLVEKKCKKEYSIPAETQLWLLIYSYRHFPLDKEDMSIKRLVLKLKTISCQFKQILYFWPSPIDNGYILPLWPEW